MSSSEHESREIPAYREDQESPSRYELLLENLSLPTPIGVTSVTGPDHGHKFQHVHDLRSFLQQTPRSRRASRPPPRRPSLPPRSKTSLAAGAAAGSGVASADCEKATAHIVHSPIRIDSKVKSYVGRPIAQRRIITCGFWIKSGTSSSCGARPVTNWSSFIVFSVSSMLPAT